MGRGEAHEVQENKWLVLHLGRNNSIYQYILGTEKLESSFEEKALGVLVENKLNVSQQGTLMAKSQHLLSCIMQSVASR